MLAELKKGDDVVTQGGIIGKISGIKDNELTLQVQEGVRLRVAPQRGDRPVHRRAARRRSRAEIRSQGLLIASAKRQHAHGTIWWWKAALYGVVTVLAVLYLVPTLVPEEKQPAFIKSHFQKRIQLGLDLQGGLHLVYEVNVDKAVSDKVDRLSSDIEDRLRRDKGVKDLTVEPRGPRRHHPHVQEPGRPGQARRERPARSTASRSTSCRPQRRHRRGAPAPRPRPGRRGAGLRASPGHRDHPRPRRQAGRRRADHHQEGDRHHRRAPRPQARRLRAHQDRSSAAPRSSSSRLSTTARST